MFSYQYLRSRIDPLPSLNLSMIPTPLVELKNLSRELGISLYCKRDDLTGFAFGGNKIRKLDFLVHDALEKKADCLVTWGANQSNWCRMTSAAGSVNGLEVYLVLAGPKPDVATANLKLDLLAGANILHIDTEDDQVIEEKCMQLCQELKDQGRSPYYISVGGSNAIGTLGYVRAFMECVEYGEQTGVQFGEMIVAAGSAGTQAGLVVGKILSGWKGKITGMTVSRSSEEQNEKIRDVVKDTLVLLGEDINESVINSSVITDDYFLGEGYRKNTPGCEEAIRIFARQEGIFLDEVYTGKAADGLIHYARNNQFGSGNVLFFHTGGNVQLFE